MNDTIFGEKWGLHVCGSRSFLVGSKTLCTFGGFHVFYVSRQAPYIIVAWQIMQK